MRNFIESKESGFTLIELVLVIAAIGILAASVTLGYGAWRQQAIKNQVISDLNQASSAMESYKNFNDGFPLSVPGTFSPSKNVVMTYASGSLTQYCIQAYNSQYADKVYRYNSTVGKVEEGACS